MVRAQPATTRDFAFFWDGLRDRKLLRQRCSECQELRHPPMTMCPNCRSFDWQVVEAGIRGRVYSYTVHHHPPLPDFAVPHPVVLADMDDGFRLLGAVHLEDAQEIKIGTPVTVEFLELPTGISSFQFRLATQAGTAAESAQ